MKMFMMALMCVLIFVGCGDSDDPVAPVEEQAVESDAVEESDAEAVVEEDAEESVDSEEEVSTLDVEQEEAEDADAEESPEVSEEDEPGLDEDPTSFESDSLPDSSFFSPQIP